MGAPQQEVNAGSLLRRPAEVTALVYRLIIAVAAEVSTSKCLQNASRKRANKDHVAPTQRGSPGHRPHDRRNPGDAANGSRVGRATLDAAGFLVVLSNRSCRRTPGFSRRLPRPSGHGRQQPAQPHDVVRRRGEGEDPRSRAVRRGVATYASQRRL